MVLAGLGKFLGGLDATTASITGMFKDTFLPAGLVSLYATILPFAELGVGLWLISGAKLKDAWFFTALLLVSLAFGLLVAKQNASDIFIYILTACAGLHFSAQDTCCLIKGKK